MSYDIYIGDIIPTADPEVRSYQPTTVASLDLPDAPCFDGDEMTGHGNHRHPAYSTWSDFAELVGLYDLFFDKAEGLMREHPGTVPITKAHLKAVTAAKKVYGRLRACGEPGWGPGQDQHLARLIWLEWWMAWAIANCKNPGLHNH